jgi:hypothetical protein
MAQTLLRNTIFSLSRDEDVEPEHKRAWELGCTTFCSPRGTHGLEKMPHQVMFDCGLLSSGRSAEAFYSTKDPMFEIG